MPQPRVVAYTTSWCPDCHRSKRLLVRRGVLRNTVTDEG